MITVNNIVWYNRSDLGLLGWENEFIVNVSAYESELGIDAGELEEIQDTGTAFATAMSALNTARAEYAAAVEAKDAARNAVIEVNRKYIAQFQAIPNLDPKVFNALDIPKRSNPGSRTAATTPDNLIAKAKADGSVSITFSRGTNSNNTVFTIEKSTNNGTTWSTAFSSTRTRVKLNGFTPGNTVWFRVYATRNNTVSTPTVPVMIWPTSGSGDVELKLAS